MAPGHVSMKFTDVEVEAKFFKIVCGIPSAHKFLVVIGKFIDPLYF